MQLNMATLSTQLESEPLLFTSRRSDRSDDLVELSGPDDPLNPQNSMAQWRKWLSATVLGAMTFSATFSSAVFAAVAPALAAELHSTPEQMALATSLFIFGFAAGPIILGPASEVYGRKAPLFAGYLAFVISQIPVARAQTVDTILIWRFIGGVASSGSPAIVGGYLADFLRPVERGVAIAIFASTTLIGPPVGAIAGSILMKSALGWRWAAWLSLIMGVVFSCLGWLIVPETYVPVVLQREARRLRLETGNWALHSKLDEDPIYLRSFVTRYLSRPFAMLVREPILMVMTLYVSFTFGMVYFLFVVSRFRHNLKMTHTRTNLSDLSTSSAIKAYSSSFIRERGFGPIQGSLPLLAVVLGIIIGSVYVSRYTLTTYSQKFQNRQEAIPEDRLPPMIIGSVLLPTGLFWFAGTCSPSSNAWPQILSGIPTGAGIQIITLQSLAYTLDIYKTRANSAVSATVIVRSLLGGLFPLVAIPMYQDLGVSLQILP